MRPLACPRQCPRPLRDAAQGGLRLLALEETCGDIRQPLGKALEDTFSPVPVKFRRRGVDFALCVPQGHLDMILFEGGVASRLPDLGDIETQEPLRCAEPPLGRIDKRDFRVGKREFKLEVLDEIPMAWHGGRCEKDSEECGAGMC